MSTSYYLDDVIVTGDAKQVACDMGYMGEDGDERLQLVSFHSTSKVRADAVLLGNAYHVYPWPAAFVQNILLFLL